MSRFIDLTGQKFCRLKVLNRTPNKGGHACWLCLCDCGKKIPVYGFNLRRGLSKSCGCLRMEVTTKHKMSGSHTYNTWDSMKGRCNNPKNAKYKDYGGRGIAVCERWNSFENFYADMGEKPKGLSINRINNDGNYEPGNCKWSTQKEQCHNMRTNRMITYQHKTMCLAEWAKELNLSPGTLGNRLDRYPPQIAFNM